MRVLASTFLVALMCAPQIGFAQTPAAAEQKKLAITSLEILETADAVLIKVMPTNDPSSTIKPGEFDQAACVYRTKPGVTDTMYNLAKSVSGGLTNGASGGIAVHEGTAAAIQFLRGSDVLASVYLVQSPESSAAVSEGQRFSVRPDLLGKLRDAMRNYDYTLTREAPSCPSVGIEY